MRLHAGAANTASEEAEISWDIDVTEAAEGAQQHVVDNNDSRPEAACEQDHSAGPPRAWPESIVRLDQDSSFRTAVLDDLHELQSFLLQQIHELSSGDALPA